MMKGRHADIAILGGGLAGGLTALALAALRPDLRVLVIEAGQTCGGNHIWSFFDSDIAKEDRWLVEPLLVARWSSHSVRFARGDRTLPIGYASITGTQLDAVLDSVLPQGAILRGCPVVAVGPGHAELADGRRIEAGAVIDARGAGHFPGLVGGWQKFVGQRLRTGPHGITAPIIMDATVAQHDGYRFIYVLPLSDDTLFVEDTYYSSSPAIDRDRLAGRIADYVRALGLAVDVMGEEQGCLPVVAGGDGEAFLNAGGQSGVARIGARAGLFHPLTSYSLPSAVTMALAIARASSFAPEALTALCEQAARQHWRAGTYFRLLARMMFAAGPPDQRHRIFARFYAQGEGLIARFYAGRMTMWDRARLLIGKPPVPLRGAMAALLGGGAPLAALGAPDGSALPLDAQPPMRDISVSASPPSASLASGEPA
ncbi:MAG: lycopene beta-cyclase CrtY [Sphingomonadales bacterium]|nr:lycopene beta-cyclase CrtY [Sphingomonadales bacterium]MDE2168707.1 lycopene beta-cyclase CrtY [Sphingomonadales bacterium]